MDEFGAATYTIPIQVPSGIAGSGPAWFKVWTKLGQISEYVDTEDARIGAQCRAGVRVWPPNKVKDTVGNYLTVTYAEDGNTGEYRPARIAYSGNETTKVEKCGGPKDSGALDVGMIKRGSFGQGIFWAVRRVERGPV